MGKRNGFLRCCHAIRHWPTSVLCVLILLLQDASLLYYLIMLKDIYWTIWAVGDVIVIVIFVLAFVFSYHYLKTQKVLRKKRDKNPEEKQRDEQQENSSGSLPLIFVSWAMYSVQLSIKVTFMFKDVIYLLDEGVFFGPNTLKSTIALAGLVFLLLLATQHNAAPGTERRRYIDELTGTVVFDILDGVDMMEILFEKEAREEFLPGIEDAIIGICCINLLLPTVPLVTLSRTKFGLDKLSPKFVLLHKLLLAYLINLPLLLTRMVIWHGTSHGISIFTLKNVIMIGMITYDVFEHLFAEHERTNTGGQQNGAEASLSVPATDFEKENYSLEDRYALDEL